MDTNDAGPPRRSTRHPARGRRVPVALAAPLLGLGASALLAWSAAAAAPEPGTPPRPVPGGEGGTSRVSPHPVRADTVVDGFHGYRFGTPASRIEEIDASGPPDERHEGLHVYTRDLHFLGEPTRAYFYLDSVRERLRRGKHLMEPGPSSCVRQLTTLRLTIAGTHPELEAEVRPGSGAADTADASSGGAPAVRCPAFMEVDSARSWHVSFRNPNTGAVEARLELFRRGGEPRILACYLNESDCTWPDSVEVRPGPSMIAPNP